MSPFSDFILMMSVGDYDISKMHYEGPGNEVPGASTGGYGYDIRTKASAASTN